MSKPNRTRSFQSCPPDDSTSVFPEEPNQQDSFDTFCDNPNAEDVNDNSDIEERKAPWYKRPSPWWMLTLMPLSAMTLAGVNPSLLQIYTELACKTIREPSIHVNDTFRSPVHSLLQLVYPLQHSGPYTWHANNVSQWEEKSCASDPLVQAAVSRIVTALLTSQGILSCITVALWASLSDRLGRRPILIISASAIVICYSVFVTVYYLADYLPGGYWMLILGSIILGLFGGTAGATAATNAYIADCTPPEGRARMFSLALGLRFTGMAIGPTLCSLVVRATGKPIAALAVLVGTHVLYVLTATLILPESLSSEKRAENRRIWRANRGGMILQDIEGGGGLRNRTSQLLLSLGRGVFSIVRPLSIIGPITVTRPSGKVHKDWSLTFIALGACLASIILASYSSMFQFAAAMFGWSAVELGYWYSGIVAARAATLTLILPIIIKMYHYYTRPTRISPRGVRTDPDPSDAMPLLAEDRNTSPTLRSTSAEQNEVQAKRTPAFDLAIAQASLALEVICYSLVPMVFSKSQVLFIVLTILASCGAGFGPAIQALAVDLYSGRGGTETGRLFGVLSVVQTISSQILGPATYGFVYMKIVATYPQGIFFVSAGAVICALTFLLFVELPGKGRFDGTRNEDSVA